MTLLFIDGFDAQDTLVKWGTTLAGAQDVAEVARYGIGSTFSAATAGRVFKAFTASSEVIIGFAFKLDSLSSTRILASLYGDAGVTQHHVLQVTSTGTVQALRGSTVLASSAAGLISVGQWYYIEMRCTVADSGGIFEVKLNGTQIINYSGDTKNAGTATTLDVLALGSTTTTDTTVTYDDLYVLNTSGAAPTNTFLNEIVVQTLVPNGPGATTELTPVGSVNNWDNVNELPYSISDYNSGDASGEADTYALTNLLSSTGTIFGIQNNYIAAKTGPGAVSMKSMVRSGGADYYGAAVPLTASPSWYGTVRETDPATSAAWTSSGVNALEAGVEVA